MTPQEKREVFKQSMLVIEKIEAVSLVHGDTKDLQVYMQEEEHVIKDEKHKKTMVSNWLTYIRRRQFVPALVASCILLFFGTTSMLAEESLPGDSLYSFKVSINESVRDLTAVSDEAKAKLAVEMTSRRLQEAAVLSAQGKLDEKSKKILQDKFAKKADEVKNRVASLVSKNNLNAAQEVVVDFESALQAHELILASLSIAPHTKGEDGSISEVSVSTDAPVIPPAQQPATAEVAALEAMVPIPAPSVSTLLASVQSELDTVKTTRINIQEKVQASILATAPASSTAPASQHIVAQLLIESNLKEARFLIQDIHAELASYPFGPSTVDFAQKRLGDASSTIDLIVMHAKNANFNDANLEVRKLQRNLAEVETVLKLEKNSKDRKENIDFAAIINASTLSHTSSSTSTVPQVVTSPEAAKNSAPTQP